MTLGEKINFYRKTRRLSQEELAERVGVSRQAVSTWENGDATPEVEKLLALARAFGVTTDELLSPEEPEDASGDAENAPSGGEEAPASPYRGAVPDSGFLTRLIRRYGYLAG